MHGNPGNATSKNPTFLLGAGPAERLLQKALITKKEYDDFGSQYTNERFWRGW